MGTPEQLQVERLSSVLATFSLNEVLEFNTMVVGFRSPEVSLHTRRLHVPKTLDLDPMESTVFLDPRRKALQDHHGNQP